jgi:hypothetical protein
VKQYVWLLIKEWMGESDEIVRAYLNEAAAEHALAVAEESIDVYYISWRVEKVEVE